MDASRYARVFGLCTQINDSSLFAWISLKAWSPTHDFTPFGEFMISPIHYIYIYYTLLNLSVLGLCLPIKDFVYLD